MNAHSIGLSSLFCTGDKAAERKGIFRSLGLNIVIKAFTAEKLDDYNYSRGLLFGLLKLSVVPQRVSEKASWNFSLHRLTSYCHCSCSSFFLSSTSPIARGLLCCSIWECKAEALSLLCSELFPFWHSACWRAAVLKHRNRKRGEVTGVWGRDLTSSM